jgi:hypothetical protein
MKDHVKKQWELYKSLRGEDLKIFPVSTKIPPKLNELRELCTVPPVYFALIEELPNEKVKLFKAIVLTEEIALGWLGPQTPVIKMPYLKTIIVALPFWVYLDEKFLLSYTNKLGVINDEDIHHLEDYAKRTKIPQDIRGEYIRSVMELLAPYNTGSILSYLEKFEEKTVIRIPDELKKKFEEQFSPKK